MLGNLDKLVWREAQPGLARMAREGHGFNVFQSENDPALNGHNNVTLCAMDSVLLDRLVSLGPWASYPFYGGDYPKHRTASGELRKNYLSVGTGRHGP